MMLLSNGHSKFSLKHTIKRRKLAEISLSLPLFSVGEQVGDEWASSRQKPEIQIRKAGSSWWQYPA